MLCFIYNKNVRHLTWSGVLVGYKIVVTLLYEVQMMQKSLALCVQLHLYSVIMDTVAKYEKKLIMINPSTVYVFDIWNYYISTLKLPLGLQNLHLVISAGNAD